MWCRKERRCGVGGTGGVVWEGEEVWCGRERKCGVGGRGSVVWGGGEEL